MSGLFKSKKSSDPVGPQFNTLYDPFASTRASLNSFLTDKIGKNGPTYPGEFVAPMSDLEKKSLDKANEYADAPNTGKNYALASDEIKKTLSGDYDPSTSPYYQAVKAEAERNLENTNKQIGDATSGGRRFFSGLREQLQAQAARDVNIDLNKTMGSLALQERQNRLAAVPQAQALDEYETNAPIKKSQALQVVGGLPRELQQALDDALLEEFIRSQYEYPLNIAQLASGPAQLEPIFTQSGFTRRQPGITSQILSMLTL